MVTGLYCRSSVPEGVDHTELSRPVMVSCPSVSTGLCDVGFLYTVVVRDLSGCGIIKWCPRKGIHPSRLASSDVNWMCGSEAVDMVWSSVNGH